MKDEPPSAVFSLPEDWTQVFVPGYIVRWCTRERGAAKLERRGKQNGLPNVIFKLNPYAQGRGRWSTISQSALLPGDSPEYGEVSIVIPSTYHEWDLPRREDFDRFLDICGRLKESYALKRLGIIARISQGEAGVIVPNDAPWTMELFVEEGSESVVLVSRGWHKNDRSAHKRVALYAERLQERGLNLERDEGLLNFASLEQTYFY